MLEEDVVTYLQTATLTAPLVASRIYPLRLRQGTTLPALTYRRVSATRDYSHGGASGLARPRLQVTCWAETYGGAKALAGAVRQDLEAGFRTFSQSLMLQNELDLFEPEAELDTVVLDYLIGHRED